MTSTVGLVVFVIYGIVLFALLAPNIVIQLPKTYSDMSRILIHGVLFSCAFIVSYLVWTILPMYQQPVSLVPLVSSVSSTPSLDASNAKTA